MPRLQYICIERIDNHLSHLHQVRKGTAKIRKKIKNAEKFTRQYEINFLNIDEDLEEDKSNEKNLMKMKMRKKQTIQNTQKKQKPVKKDKKHKQISQHSSDSQSTISSPKSKFKKMPRSTAKHSQSFEIQKHLLVKVSQTPQKSLEKKDEN